MRKYTQQIYGHVVTLSLSPCLRQPNARAAVGIVLRCSLYRVQLRFIMHVFSINTPIPPAHMQATYGLAAAEELTVRTPAAKRGGSRGCEFSMEGRCGPAGNSGMPACTITPYAVSLSPCSRVAVEG